MRVVFPLLLILTLTACQLRPPEDPLATLDAALAAEDYGTAWRVMQRQGDDAPEALQTRMRSAREAIIQFERDSIRRAQRQAGDGDWQQALGTLDQAIRQWPYGEPLRRARSELDQQQLTSLVALRTELFADEAQWLHSQRVALDKLAHYADPSARALSARLTEREADVRDELVALGEWHAGQQNWRLTRKALRAAASLDEQYASHPALAQAESRLSSASQRAREHRSETLREEARTRLARYRTSQAVPDLVSARHYIREHRQRGHLEAEHETVERLCRERFVRDNAEGDARYARGDYVGAYQLWQAVAPLMPEDTELAKKLDRTRRVMESLEQLKAGSSPARQTTPATD
ncbi:hypothetical protein A167_03013 [Alcanivorax sp. S71-1-4]|uniref:hypothetical protein n=1 Tax=Alcanivorax sp. S71-1-4 TaxID=1177159 RepID=UPI00135C984B|nr:hypothetical protein [Alcanivorax sp. S71-1-4]KAF0807211.1 hypothetical protein A167_03013 [Alcanivorax sp. S71-1-4]